MSRLTRIWPWLAFAGLALWLYLDASFWHPGFSYFDEGNGSLNPVQLWREGGYRLPFELIRGCLHRDLAAALMRALGPTLWAWRLIDLLAIGVESIMLWALVRRYASETAAMAAVLVNLLSAVTLVRARSLCSYALTPLELLLMLSLIPRLSTRLRAFGFGLLAALFLTDYEGWIIAMPVIALYLLVSERRGSFGWVSLGLVSLLLPLLYLSQESLSQQLLLRARALSQGPGHLALLAANLKALFQGAWSYGYMAVSHHPYLPFWLWPLLLLGLAAALIQAPMLIVWLLLGLVPLVAGGTAGGSNRLIVAWPAICALAGLGWAALNALLPSPAQRVAALLLFTALVAKVELGAYQASMSEQYPLYYSDSAQQIVQARAARAAGPAELISELDNESSAMWRFIWEGEGPPRGRGRVLALMPRDYLRSAGCQHLQCFELSGQDEARFRAVDAELRQLRRSLPLHYNQKRLEQMTRYLDEHRKLDPWLRSALLENALGLSFMTGSLPPSLLAVSLYAPLQSGAGPRWLAVRAAQSGDQALAARLMARARAIDPRAPCAE